MEQSKNIVLIYGTVFTLFTVIFILLFHTPLFKGEDVLFYRGNYLLLVTISIVSLGVFISYRRGLSLSIESMIAATVTSAALHLVFFVVFPVTFDRSVTLFLLERLEVAPIEASCPGYSKQELEVLLIDEYIKNREAVSRRIHEQSKINMISEGNTCVLLTNQGKSFLDFSRFVGRIYSIKNQ